MQKLIRLMMAGVVVATPAAVHAQKPAVKPAAAPAAKPAATPAAKPTAQPTATPATVATVDPGMSRDQVVAALGKPYSTSARGGFTYLMYHNGCEKTCGMDDLVVLDSGKVVDAVFRSPARHYSGTSSSPHMITADQAAKKGGGTAAPTQDVKQTGTPKVAPKPDTKTPPATTAPKKP